MRRWWKPKSISTKLFALTSVLLIAFLTVLMLVQSTFFESYYQSKKMNQLKQGLANFKSLYYKSPADLSTLPKLFPELEKNLSATAAIMQLRDGLVTTGPQTKTKAIIQIDKTGQIVNSSISPLPAFEPETMMSLMTAINQFRGDTNLTRRVVDLGETASYVTRTSDRSGKYIAAVVPLSKDGITGMTDSLLLAVTSLQPVGEAAGIMKDFYLYFLLLAVLAILLLTYMYSRMISRPLIKLNNAAAQMAKLDFSVKCEVQSQDEIGSLGRTLNFLSGNLNETLGQLHTANVQLKADIEKEKELEKLRREFVASVSHELKTPISLISGYAEGLKDGIVSGARREDYLDVILEESGRMAGLVQDMLDLSQLESGKFTLTVAEFQLHELIHSTVDNMFMEFERRGIQCLLELQGPAVAYGDATRIRQVLTNLLSNASKHAAAGGNIRIRTSTVNEDVQVDIFNEGAPIPEADLPRIWETFYTVEKSHNREHAGSGIGLAIVHNILTLHGGKFGVFNTSTGVTFYFTLQLAPPEERTYA